MKAIPSLVAVAAIAFASTVSGQTAAPFSNRPNLISANPITVLFGFYNAEFEHALQPTVSIAAAGSLFDYGSGQYTNLDGILRYYPAARAIRGFSVGLSVGVSSFNDDDSGDFYTDDSETVGTLGVRGDYVWLLGRDQRFAVAAGVGAKRLFGSDATEGLPIARLSVGYAF
ncbi:MAG: hypothetical protein ABIS03_08205 [Gemmatimonadaceae bacterium]